MNNVVFVHKEKPVEDLFHEEFELRLAEDDLLSAQDSIQVKFNVFKDKIDSLTFTAYDIN